MAATNSSKTPKRKARDSDRELAADLARRYWENDPYQIEIEGQVYYIDIDGDELARSLQRFAENGTFEIPDSATIFERTQALQKEVEYLQTKRKMSAKLAIETTMKQWKVSKQTVVDAVYGRKNRKIGIPADAPKGIDQVVLDPLYLQKLRKA